MKKWSMPLPAGDQQCTSPTMLSRKQIKQSDRSENAEARIATFPAADNMDNNCKPMPANIDAYPCQNYQLAISRLVQQNEQLAIKPAMPPVKPAVKQSYAQALQPKNHNIILDGLPPWCGDTMILNFLYELWLPADCIELSYTPFVSRMAIAKIRWVLGPFFARLRASLTITSGVLLAGTFHNRWSY
jgi:hypothetical protein